MFFNEKKDHRTTEQVIEDKVNEMKKKGGSINEYDFLGTLSACFVIANPPIAIVLTLCACIASAIKKETSLKEQKMPDDWLKKVSESEQISKKGVQFLAKKLSKKGFVSVSDALTFLELEKEIKEKEYKANEKVKSLRNIGALSLLEKANKEVPGLYNASIDTFKKSLDVLSDVGETAKDLSNKGIIAVKELIKKS
jgi:predicted transcriptional regulator